MQRFDAQLLALCLMGNYHHFVLHTRRANQTGLMRHFNVVYTQAFKFCPLKVGHFYVRGPF